MNTRHLITPTVLILLAISSSAQNANAALAEAQQKERKPAFEQKASKPEGKNKESEMAEPVAYEAEAAKAEVNYDASSKELAEKKKQQAEQAQQVEHTDDIKGDIKSDLKGDIKGDIKSDLKGDSPFQSAARPYDLDIAGPVQIAGSDKASKVFQSETLPTMLKMIDGTISGYEGFDSLGKYMEKLDPSSLKLEKDTNARVYFLGENSQSRNSLGAITQDDKINNRPQLIFPDASSGKERSDDTPLQAGDFVDLSAYKAGTLLDFFMIADGANGGEKYAMTGYNDGIVHAWNYSQDGSPYLIFSFADFYKGEVSSNTGLIFAVSLSSKSSLGAPEPTLAAGSLLALGAIFGLKRRR